MFSVWKLNRVFCLCFCWHVLSVKGYSNRASSLLSQKQHTAHSRPWKTSSKASVLHLYIDLQLKKCKERILCEWLFIFVSVCLNILLCLYCTGCFETPKNWSLNTDAQFQLLKNSFFFGCLFLNQPTRVSWGLGAYFFLKLHHNICLLNVLSWVKCLHADLQTQASVKLGLSD